MLTSIGAGGVQALSAAPAEQQAAPKAAPQQEAPKAAQYEMDKEASNVRLDIDSNSTEPEQQRDVACSLEVGQHVGNGEHQEASCRGSKDSELMKIAARNLKYFIEHAQFSSFADKRAALNCLDALAAPQQEAQEPFCYVSVNKQGDITRTMKRKDKWTNIPLYTTPQPAQVQPVVQGPLTDEQIDALIAAKHFREGYELTASVKVCINWYRLGLRDGERAHGITKGGSNAEL